MNFSLRCALGVVLWCGCLGAVAAGQTLRVLSYNIHHGEGRDGVVDLARIAEVIKRAEPDVVALQELDHGNERSGSDVYQIRDLARLTGLTGRFAKSMDYRGGAYGNGLLFGPKVALVELQVRPLPNPRKCEPRAVIEAKLRFRGERGRRFVLYATHLDVTHENAVAQSRALAALGEAVEAPALVAGDFNLRSNDDAIAELAETWTDAAAAESARRPPIDYVMFRPASRWRVRSAGRFLVDEVSAVASDHYPLLAELELAE